MRLPNRLIGLLAAAVFAGAAAAGALADDSATVAPGLNAPLATGDVVISGFSGAHLPVHTVPAGVDPVTETVIDPDGASLRILDLSTLGGPTVGQVVDAPAALAVPASEIGQVFALAFDDGNGSSAPNLYAAATSAYGLQIVGALGPDGVQTRLTQGAPGAAFMAGQFGSLPGAGPGSIYRIDGTTGAVTIFGDTGFSGVLNTGAGIGGLAFDPQSGDIYASDLDTGLIHRFRSDMPGSDLGQYDHGVTALAALGLQQMPDDGVFANIVDPTFHPADPSTWGLTPVARRIGALAVHDGRLFYSVADGPTIWSVGLGADGSFGDDPRVEVAVTDGVAAPITGIVFDGQGNMIVAQRGDQQSPFDYGSFTATGAPVLRFAPASPDAGTLWSDTPDEYPVGLPDGSRMGAGGVALTNGYNPDGTLGAACGATLLTTGDDLRDNAALASQLPPGPANLTGLQINDASLIGPQNTPPALSAFVPFDANQADPKASGHVGSVAAVPCGSAGARTASPSASQGAAPTKTAPGASTGGQAPASNGNAASTANPGSAPPAPGDNVNPAQASDNGPLQPLTISKTATVDSCDEEAGGCSFAITIHNPNQTAVPGPVSLEEVFSANGAALPQSQMSTGPDAPWTCLSAGGPTLTCNNADGVQPGDTTLNVTFTPGQIGQASDVMNCVQLLTPDATPFQLTVPPPMTLPPPAPTASTENGLAATVSSGGGTCSPTSDDACVFVLFVDQDNVPKGQQLKISHTFTLGADPTPVPVTIVEQTGLPPGMSSSSCIPSADGTAYDCLGTTDSGALHFNSILKVLPKLPAGSPASALVDHVKVSSNGVVGSTTDSAIFKDAQAPTTADVDVQKNFAPQQCAVIPVNKNPIGMPRLDKPATIVDGLKLVKTVDPSTPNCAPGTQCVFDITITNTADTPHAGKISFTETMANPNGENSTPIASPMMLGIDSPWTCDPLHDAQTKCSSDQTIAAGQTVVAKVRVTPDKDFTGSALANCAGLDGGFGASCAQIPVDQPKPSTVNGITISKKVTDGHGACTVDDQASPCSFDITVANPTNADIPGPIVIHEKVTGADGKNPGFPGDGYIITPPNTWSCNKGSEFDCTAEGPLKAGQSMTMTMAFTPIVKADSPFVKNCANLPGGDTPACATEAIDAAAMAQPAPANKPPVSRLVIDESTQTSSAAAVHQSAGDIGSCTLAGPCSFGIAITNTGTTTFTGPLSLSSGIGDGGHLAGTVLVIQSVTGSSDDPNWSCASTTQSGFTQLQCDYRGQIMLAPGQGTLVREVVIPGSGWVKSNRMNSCANTSADPDSGRIGTNWCATRILDPFNVKIQKTGDQSCPAGADCHFQLTLFNPGPIDHNAPVTISDKLNFGTAPIVSINPPLPCATQPTQVPFTCTSPEPISLPLGGAPQIFDMVIRLPAGERGYTNCATVGPDADAAVSSADSTTSCASTVVTPAKPADNNTGGTNGTQPNNPSASPSVSLTKTGAAQCQIGGVCNFTLTLTGHGTFNGDYNLRDSLDIGAADIVSMDPFCDKAPSRLPFNCVSPTASFQMSNGQQTTYHIAIRVPSQTTAAQLTNCAAIESTDKEAWEAGIKTDWQPNSCATVPLKPAALPSGFGPDLRLQKTGGPQCEIGGICNFTLFFSSKTGFSGTVYLHDSMDIGSAPIVSATPGLPCARPQTQLPLTCDQQAVPLGLQAGQLKPYLITIRIPDRITASTLTNCANVEVWGWSKDFGGLIPQPPKSCVTVTLTPKKNPILQNSPKAANGPNTGGFNKVYPQDGTVTLRKTGDEQCAIDGLCNFNLTLSSTSGYTGPIHLSDSLDIGGASIVSIQPPLACGTTPTQLPLQCDTAGQPVVNVTPASPLTYRMTIRVPNTSATQMTNCASVTTPSPLDNLGLFNSPVPSCVTTALSPANSNPASQCFSNMVPDGKGGCGCPPGQTWDGTQCGSNTGGTNGVTPAPAQALSCPTGTVGVYPSCRAVPPKQAPKALPKPVCPAGTTGTYPNCKASISGGINKIAPGASKPKCAVGTHPSTSGRSCIADPKSKPKAPPKPQQLCPRGAYGTYPNCQCPDGSRYSQRGNSCRPEARAPSFQGMPDINIGGFNMNSGGFQMNGGGFGRGSFGGDDGGSRKRFRPRNGGGGQAPKGGGGVVNPPPANNGGPPPGGGGKVKPPICPGGVLPDGSCDIVVK